MFQSLEANNSNEIFKHTDLVIIKLVIIILYQVKHVGTSEVKVDQDKTTDVITVTKP